jgi:Flp pilus assembly protein TadD
VVAQPLEAGAHLLLGMLQLDEGEIEPALESLRRATFLDASNALAHFSLGRAYLRVGSAQRARAALTHARRLLAPLPDAEPVPGGDGVAVGELRRAVDAHLDSLVRSGGDTRTAR